MCMALFGSVRTAAINNHRMTLKERKLFKREVDVIICAASGDPEKDSRFANSKHQ